MTQLAAWIFDRDQDVRRLELTLGQLASRHKLLLRDGRVVNWPAGSDRPQARRVYSVPLTDALDDIVWGILLGHVLYGTGGAGPSLLAELGISDVVLTELRQGLSPGLPALIVLGEDDQIHLLARGMAPAEADVRTDLVVER